MSDLPRTVLDPAAYSVATFCESHGFGRGTLYALWRKGKGPRFIKVGRRTLIPGEAAAEWRQKLLADGKAGTQ